MIRRVWLGAAGGMFAGALLGFGEALVLLSRTSMGESGALVYGVVFYGLLGFAVGIGPGIGLSLLGRDRRDAFCWALGFSSVAGLLGARIAAGLLGRLLYGDRGLPFQLDLVILGATGLLVALGLWLGSALLERTRLRVLLRPSGALGTMLVGVGLTAAFSLPSSGTSPEGVRVPPREQSAELVASPRVLFIVVGSLRADALGAYGAPEGTTPNLDALAADSVLFDDAVASASETRDSVASMMTSLAPSGHGAQGEVAAISDGLVTLAEVMAARGYVTGGLPSSPEVSRLSRLQQGFDWFSYQAPARLPGATESAGQLSFYAPVLALGLRLGGTAVRAEHPPPAPVLSRARGFLDANAGRAWFLWVHLMAPGDAELGELIGWLKQRVLYDNTAIVVSSDHGEALGEHGVWGHGHTLYDEVLHVPMILKLPHQKAAGVRVPWQVRGIDLAPTLAVLVGAPVPPSWQGRDLLEPGFEAAAAAAAGPGATAILDAWSRPLLAELDCRGDALRAVRLRNWKYITNNEENARGMPPEELYDLAHDPAEQENLAGTGMPEQRELARLLRQLRQEAARGRAGSQSAEVHDADCQRLLQLGYVDRCE